MLKKICMIIPGFDAKGGIASVVSGYRGSDLENRYDIHYVETYCDGGKLAKLGKAITGYLRFIKLLFTSKPDLVHIHSSFGASFYRKLPYIYLAVLFRIPVINHIHGSELTGFYWDISPIFQRIKRNTFQKCSKIIVLSNEWKERFSGIMPKEKMYVIENYSVLNGRGASSDNAGKTVLFMGFLNKLKGCLDIPPIIASVKDSIKDVVFVLAGSGNEEDTQAILSLVKDFDIEKNIMFPGWVRNEEKRSLLNKASLYFLPSYTEGMPMSILEAMGYGMPIVSTNVGGIPQLVKNDYNGYLCEPGDVESMATAIIEILQDEEKRKRMGEASAAIVAERFSLKQHIDKLTEIYEGLF